MAAKILLPTPPLSTFSQGTLTDGRTWLLRMENITATLYERPDDRIRYVSSFLFGPALDWYNITINPLFHPIAWDTFRAEFEDFCNCCIPDPKQSFLNRSQKEEESVVNYYFALLALIQDQQSTMQDDEKLTHLSRGLLPTAAAHLELFPVTTTIDFLMIMQRFDKAQARLKLIPPSATVENPTTINIKIAELMTKIEELPATCSVQQLPPPPPQQQQNNSQQQQRVVPYSRPPPQQNTNFRRRRRGRPQRRVDKENYPPPFQQQQQQYDKFCHFHQSTAHSFDECLARAPPKNELSGNWRSNQ
jgi:hypothetical protein